MSKSKDLANKYLEDKDIEALFKACLQHMQDVIKMRHCSTNQDYANAVKEANDIWKASASIINKSLGNNTVLDNGFLNVLKKHLPSLYDVFVLVNKAISQSRELKGSSWMKK